ncbi:transglycosylase SLT domain-containing protein [Bdellovibrio sp. SKB1291214]|uniref:lytic transglycosylase domain-containing protein n=1 Tax=Bdellovibrio sp. SKB1291214 TaxID=1732569 RepID=UPI0020CE349F|nr:transglycosylase SLT domain-containing protein [Bdellovibrio sp. SKB1291214]UYL09692.1 transglycosylase SLT domain-containing protein [Bdellovibrio sp. SKB1291214]
MSGMSLLLKLLVTSATAAPAGPSAVVRKIDVNKDLKGSGYVDLYDMDPKKLSKLPALAQLKGHEINGHWNECLTLSPKVFAAQKELKGWVGQVWLHCLDKAQQKKTSAGQEDRVLTAIAKSWNLFEEGPWSQDLWNMWVTQELSYLDSEAKKKNRKIESRIERLLDRSAKLSREQKSQCYQMLGDFALNANEYVQAQFLYEEAQSYKDSRYLTDKLDFLAKARSQTVKPAATVQVEAIGEDGKLEERIRQSLKTNDLIPALKDTISLLNQYPGGRAARRLKDKPLEIYNSISDKMVAEKALVEMGEADASRLLEWAQNLHRKGDWPSSLVLAQKSYDKSSQSPAMVSALWVASRSAHFLGQYDKALDLYNKLIVMANGSDESSEALFRSSLIYYRKKEFTTAAALLERLVQQGKDRYDLNAQYWLVRSLQSFSKERADKAAQALMDKYPFSYYGLRLRAETQNGKLTWPEVTDKNPALADSIFLVGTQKKSWDRFLSLSQAGWVSEAQTELNDLPAIKDPTLKVALAEKLSQRGQYFNAIRLVNDALENDPRLRQEKFLKIGYPEVFTTLYKKEADRYGIDVILLRSLTRQESGFNMKAVSTSNALGLMQMIPPTAADTAKRLGMKVEVPEDMFRPEVNIPMGSYYVSQMLGQFAQSVPFALAAYNAGPYRLKKWIEARPEISSAMTSPVAAPEGEVWVDELPWNETSFYVKAILRNTLLYQMIGKESYSVQPIIWQDLLTKKAK